ncbi:MAG: DUF4082 domain-containing protein, partial [Actinomycetota bacterium]|nr:DUF4082 domain-containing protein [Actinomycetota bacterium]
MGATECTCASGWQGAACDVDATGVCAAALIGATTSVQRASQCATEYDECVLVSNKSPAVDTCVRYAPGSPCVHLALFAQPGDTDYQGYGGTVVYGYAFTVTSPIVVRALRAFLSNDVSYDNALIRLRLWSAAAPATPLADVTRTLALSDFDFESLRAWGVLPLASELTLQPGEYRIGADAAQIISEAISGVPALTADTTGVVYTGDVIDSDADGYPDAPNTVGNHTPLIDLVWRSADACVVPQPTCAQVDDAYASFHACASRLECAWTTLAGTCDRYAATNACTDRVTVFDAVPEPGAPSGMTVAATATGFELVPGASFVAGRVAPYLVTAVRVFVQVGVPGAEMRIVLRRADLVGVPHLIDTIWRYDGAATDYEGWVTVPLSMPVALPLTGTESYYLSATDLFDPSGASPLRAYPFVSGTPYTAGALLFINTFRRDTVGDGATLALATGQTSFPLLDLVVRECPGDTLPVCTTTLWKAPVPTGRGVASPQEMGLLLQVGAEARTLHRVGYAPYMSAFGALRLWRVSTQTLVAHVDLRRTQIVGAPSFAFAYYLFPVRLEANTQYVLSMPIEGAVQGTITPAASLNETRGISVVGTRVSPTEGTYPDQVSVDPVFAGFFPALDLEWRSACVAPDLGATTCTAGQYLDAGVCHACQAGRYTTVGALSQCTACPINNYQNATGATTCFACDATRADTGGQTAATACTCLAGRGNAVCSVTDCGLAASTFNECNGAFRRECHWDWTASVCIPGPACPFLRFQQADCVAAQSLCQPSFPDELLAGQLFCPFRNGTACDAITHVDQCEASVDSLASSGTAPSEWYPCQWLVAEARCVRYCSSRNATDCAGDARCGLNSIQACRPLTSLPPVNTTVVCAATPVGHVGFNATHCADPMAIATTDALYGLSGVTFEVRARGQLERVWFFRGDTRALTVSLGVFRLPQRVLAASAPLSRAYDGPVVQLAATSKATTGAAGWQWFDVDVALDANVTYVATVSYPGAVGVRVPLVAGWNSTAQVVFLESAVRTTGWNGGGVELLPAGDTSNLVDIGFRVSTLACVETATPPGVENLYPLHCLDTARPPTRTAPGYSGATFSPTHTGFVTGAWFVRLNASASEEVVVSLHAGVPAPDRLGGWLRALYTDVVLLASANQTGWAQGWQRIAFAAPVQVLAGATYVVSVTSPGAPLLYAADETRGVASTPELRWIEATSVTGVPTQIAFAGTNRHHYVDVDFRVASGTEYVPVPRPPPTLVTVPVVIQLSDAYAANTTLLGEAFLAELALLLPGANATIVGVTLGTEPGTLVIQVAMEETAARTLQQFETLYAT